MDPRLPLSATLLGAAQPASSWTPAPPEPPAPRPSPLRGLELLVFLGAFALDVAFLGSFVVNPVDFCLTSREATDA